MHRRATQALLKTDEGDAFVHFLHLPALSRILFQRATEIDHSVVNFYFRTTDTLQPKVREKEAVTGAAHLFFFNLQFAICNLQSAIPWRGSSVRHKTARLREDLSCGISRLAGCLSWLERRNHDLPQKSRDRLRSGVRVKAKMVHAQRICSFSISNLQSAICNSLAG